MKKIANLLKKLLETFTVNEKKMFLKLQVYLIVAGGVQLVSIGLVFPFMQILLNPTEQMPEAWLILIRYFNVQELHNLKLLGLCLVGFFSLSTFFVLFTRKRMIFLGQEFGAHISSRLYDKYLRKNYLFHISNNSSGLVSNVVQETERIVYHVVTPLLFINQQIVFILFIAGFLVFQYKLLVIIAFLAVCLAYLLVYKLVEDIVKANGKALAELNKERLILLSEGFSGIKDVKLYGNNHFFVDKFLHTSERRALSISSTTYISTYPRFVLEWFVFVTAIGVLLYLFYDNRNMQNVIPHVSVLAVAAIKLLPAFQQIFASLTSIKSCESSFWNITEELTGHDKDEDLVITQNSHPDGGLIVENVNFQYPKSDQNTLTNVSCRITKGSAVAFIGGTGSGKTTLLNIINGLILPESGNIYYDNKSIFLNINKWQELISYVSQDIYLSDRSIVENIAFGKRVDEIDICKVKDSLRNADLTEYLKTLPLGMDTIVGERGIQLSGGQRQRIAIARALYFDSEIIIFDEGTSALDNITEQKIIDSLYSLKGTRTIIMVAHRLTSIKNCDEIFVIEKGQIKESGHYETLIKKGGLLSKMSLSK